MPRGVYPRKRKKRFPAMSMKQVRAMKMASKPYEYDTEPVKVSRILHLLDVTGILLKMLREELGGSE